MLYEPTFIIPSNLTQTGTVAVADNVDIEWQVNGNSPMTAFQIDVMLNDTDSTLVYSTGIIQLDTPFYGKDRYGNYVSYEYAPDGTTWGDWGLSDGEEYKFNISQFYKEYNNMYAYTLTEDLSSGITYGLVFIVNGEVYTGITFTVEDEELFKSGTRIYYSISSSSGWVLLSDGRYVSNLTFAYSAEYSEDSASWIGLSDGINQITSDDTFYHTWFVTTNTASAFITRTAPELSIDAFDTPVATSIKTFTATYTQEQLDAVQTVQWQLFPLLDLDTVLDDTGEVNTPLLEYEFDGFLNENEYRLQCTVTTQNGISVTAYVDFTVYFAPKVYSGVFSYLCSSSQGNYNYLTWTVPDSVEGVVEPSSGYTFDDDMLNLSDGATITWSYSINQNNDKEAIAYGTPWCLSFSFFLSSIDRTSSPVIATIGQASGDIVISYNSEYTINVTQGDTTLATMEVHSSADLVNIALVNSSDIDGDHCTIYAYYFKGNNTAYLGYFSETFDYSQETLTSIQLTGEMSCQWLCIIQGDSTSESVTELLGNLVSNTYYPSISSDSAIAYYMLVDFSNSDLNGYNESSLVSGFRIYRTSSDSTSATLDLVAKLPSTVTQFKDYSIVSRTEYTYYLYAYDVYDAFMASVELETTLCRTFPGETLLATEYNEDDESYHVVKEYQFNCNVDEISISNNYSASFEKNFTQYPTLFRSTTNYISGELKAYIGSVSTSSGRYSDSVSLMKELNALATEDYTYFVKTSKGNIWMVAIGSAIQQTIARGSYEMPVSVSLPYTEIGDASDVLIIMTPEDEAWGETDYEVLNVSLSVDMETGELIVTYPASYTGSTFYIDEETEELSVTIPDTYEETAVNTLSDVAVETTDGQLTATKRSS